MKVIDLKRVVTLLVVASAISVASSAAEMRPAQRTDIQQLTAELAARYGERRAELPSRSPAPTVGSRAKGGIGEAEVRYASIPLSEILLEMNRARGGYGLPPLKLDHRLSLAASDRMSDMLTLGYFNHESPDGRSPFASIAPYGYRYRTAAENLAVGYGSARQVVNAWMRSPGHRANILSRDFRDVGIAAAGEAPLPHMTGHTFVALYAAP